METTDRIRVHAGDVSWQERARCNGAPVDFTPNIEKRADLEAVRGAYCNLCPVQTDCLLYAILYREQGYWGGTDTAERRKLSKRRGRVKCPVCLSKAIIELEGHGICQRCGVSWAGDAVPRVAEGATE